MLRPFLALQALFALGVHAGAITALKYTHVGGSGTYDQVIKMVPGSWPSCTINLSCITAPKSVSGNLAPFDEEITMAFRGPMNLHNIAVYQPASPSGGTWSRMSSWNQGSQPDNLVFMNNKGGSKSGEWDSKCSRLTLDITDVETDSCPSYSKACGGSSQSYANGDWTDATTAPNLETYAGNLKGGNEIVSFSPFREPIHSSSSLTYPL